MYPVKSKNLPCLMLYIGMVPLFLFKLCVVFSNPSLMEFCPDLAYCYAFKTFLLCIISARNNMNVSLNLEF